VKGREVMVKGFAAILDDLDDPATSMTDRFGRCHDQPNRAMAG
jgi:hypothetical protein